MADKKTNIPPVTKATSVAVAPTDGLDTAATLPAHCQPCPPTIRLDAPLRWKAANSKEQKLLRNLQGNILKGHGRDHTWNVFFTFGGDNAKTRRLLRQLGNGFVTDAYKQLLATEAFKTDDKKDGGTFCAAFLSAKGYQTLGLTFTAPPANAAFDAGMKAGQVALGDPPSTAWEAPFQQELHAMVLDRRRRRRAGLGRGRVDPPADRATRAAPSTTRRRARRSAIRWATGSSTSATSTAAASR